MQSSPLLRRYGQTLSRCHRNELTDSHVRLGTLTCTRVADPCPFFSPGLSSKPAENWRSWACTSAPSTGWMTVAPPAFASREQVAVHPLWSLCNSWARRHGRYLHLVRWSQCKETSPPAPRNSAWWATAGSDPGVSPRRELATLLTWNSASLWPPRLGQCFLTL